MKTTIRIVSAVVVSGVLAALASGTAFGEEFDCGWEHRERERFQEELRELHEWERLEMTQWAQDERAACEEKSKRHASDSEQDRRAIAERRIQQQKLQHERHLERLEREHEHMLELERLERQHREQMHERDRLERECRGQMRDRKRECRERCEREQAKQVLREQRRQNGQAMLREEAAKRAEKERKDQEKSDGQMRCGILVGLIIVLVLGYKSLTHANEEAEGRAYDAKHRNEHACAYCGRTRHTVHQIYHSVLKRENVVGHEHVVHRCGFAIYMCDECLSTHKRKLVRLRILKAVVMVIVVALGIFGMVKVDRNYAGIAYSCFSSVCIVTAFVCFRRTGKSDNAWEKLIAKHPAIDRFLKAGYVFGEDRPRLVRKADTKDCQKDVRHFQRYGSWTEHLTYEWMGVLRDFRGKARIDGAVRKAVQTMREKEERGDWKKPFAAANYSGLGYIMLLIVVVVQFAGGIYVSMIVASASGYPLLGFVCGVACLMITVYLLGLIGGRK